MTDNTEALPPLPEKWCLFCDKAGHQSHECWSTYGDNTPRSNELLRLAALAQRQQVPGDWPTLREELEDVCKAADQGANGWVRTSRIREALTAAPSAQAEPVGWVVPEHLAELQRDYSRLLVVSKDKSGFCTAPIYTSPPAAQAEPQEPLPYGFKSGLVQLLNEARCLEDRIVSNRELASRIVDYIRHGIGKQESK